MKQLYAVLLMPAILLLGLAAPDFAQGAPQGQSGASTAAGKPRIIKYTRGMGVNSLAGKPDTDEIELPSGRRMTVGDARRLQAAAQKMRAAVPGSRANAALKVKPAATGTLVKTKADIAAALKRPGNETIQFPNGQRITVAQLKFMQPFIEKKVGHKIDILSRRPNLSGPATRVSQTTTKAEWESILRQPDNTVLESQNGKRITVGELKQYMTQNKGKIRKVSAPGKAMPGAVPQKTAPASSLKKR